MMRRSSTAHQAGVKTVPMRTIVLWCPDWPVTAALRSNPSLRADAPLALVEAGLVFACSAAARQQGIRRGLRVREAQSRCPDLTLIDYDSTLDIRSFEPVLDAIEETMPGVQLLRPGTCAVRARGPASYYGGEEEAALWLLDALDSLAIHGARIGIADGPFAAEHAARSPRRQRIHIIAEGESAEFLAPMPVGLLGDVALSTLLRRLGIRTLGEFSELGSADVASRFGGQGVRLHALAKGLDSRPVVPRTMQEQFDSVIEFEPPLDRVDQVAFSFRAPADKFIEQLVRAKLVCTSIRIEIDSESGEFSERSWLHPRSFTAADVVDRVRWQLQGSESSAGSSAESSSASGLTSRVAQVRVVPESVDAIGNHEQGLWGTGYDERIHHGLSRVQSMLGHGGVVTAVVGGGRTLLDRQSLVAWGDRREPTLSGNQPWPGQLPTPTPATVFEIPRAAVVMDASGLTVDLDARGSLTAPPHSVSTDGRSFTSVTAWAGPWTIDERWWDVPNSRRASRLQLVDGNGMAWLLVLEDHLWWSEARYD